MKANVNCPNISDMRAALLEICLENGKTVDDTYVCGSDKGERGDNSYGLVCAINGDKVVACVPFWRSDDGIYVMQTDIIPGRQLRFHKA